MGKLLEIARVLAQSQTERRPDVQSLLHQCLHGQSAGPRGK